MQLCQEPQFQPERETEENRARSISPEEARSVARASIGKAPKAVEECYGARSVALLDNLAQDLRYGLRTMLKYRSFTVVTVFTLALGIGACTAIFSLVNAVLIRRLPYGEAGRLVYLFTPNPLWNLPAEMFGPSNADFFDLKGQSKSFSATTLFFQTTFNLAGNDRAERVGAAKVDADFFCDAEGRSRSWPWLRREG